MANLRNLNIFQQNLNVLKYSNNNNLVFKLDSGELFNDFGLDAEGWALFNNRAFYAVYNNYIIVVYNDGLTLNYCDENKAYELNLSDFEDIIFTAAIAVNLISILKSLNAEDFIKFAEANFVKI